MPSKDTPLAIPNDSQALPSLLTRWASAINNRLREIELNHSNLQQQLNTVVKANTLKR